MVESLGAVRSAGAAELDSLPLPRRNTAVQVLSPPLSKGSHGDERPPATRPALVRTTNPLATVAFVSIGARRSLAQSRGAPGLLRRHEEKENHMT